MTMASWSMQALEATRERIEVLGRDLMQGPAPVAPYATGNSLTLVSSRIGCFRSSAYPNHFFPNLAALCLRQVQP